MHHGRAWRLRNRKVGAVMDIKAGDVRIKVGSARIVVDVSGGHIAYVAIDGKSCWQTTWASWGKKADHPIIQIGGKHYRVMVEEVT
jgi:hypothetical protein